MAEADYRTQAPEMTMSFETAALRREPLEDSSSRPGRGPTGI
jgi:hypothetical protein